MRSLLGYFQVPTPRYYVRKACPNDRETHQRARELNRESGKQQQAGQLFPVFLYVLASLRQTSVIASKLCHCDHGLRFGTG